MEHLTEYGISIEDIRAAAKRIAPYAHRTPILTSSTIDGMASKNLFFKCENLQKAGAFKFRGACNAVMSLTSEEAAKGVVTHSSGNHGQALALAARLRGIPAYVVMPKTSKAPKVAAVEGYGGRVYFCEPTLAARNEMAQKVQAETGATFIHPYEDLRVIAGQGTVALELMEQVNGLDAIVVPVGGGGLLAGVTICVKAVAPGIRIFGAEPEGADDAARSKRASTLLPQTSPKTICDGLLTSLGQATWPVIRDLVEDIIIVSDREVILSMRLLLERMKLVVEPSGAIALAAVLSRPFQDLSDVRRVGVVLSGGNLDIDEPVWLHVGKI